MESLRESKRLCSECVGDGFLRSQINVRGEEALCSYCEVRTRTFSIGEMADEVETALGEHFYRTPTEPSGIESSAVREGELDWERRGEPVTDVIEACATIAEEPATDIREALKDRHFDFDDAQLGY